MHQHHLTLLLFLLLSTALGAVMPSLRPHDQLQLAGETALKVRDLDPLEARGKRKQSAPETSLNTPSFEFGEYRELHSDLVGLYPNNAGFIMFLRDDGCPDLVSVAMIRKKAIIDAEEELARKQKSAEHSDPEQLDAEQLNVEQPKTVRVGRYLPTSLKEAAGILIDGPYRFQRHYVYLSDTVESSNPRMRRIFTFNAKHTHILMHELGLVALLPPHLEGFASRGVVRNKLGLPWFPARIKTTHSADPEWAFLERKSLKGDGKYLAAVLGLHEDSDYINTKYYLPTCRPGPYLSSAAIEQVKTIQEKPYGFEYRLVEMDQLIWPEKGSADDFTIPYNRVPDLRSKLRSRFGSKPEDNL